MRRELLSVQGRSINMALSVRGIEALKAVGLDARVLETAIPMRGRMVHGAGRDRGSHIIPYGDFGEVLATPLGGRPLMQPPWASPR